MRPTSTSTARKTVLAVIGLALAAVSLSACSQPASSAPTSAAAGSAAATGGPAVKFGSYVDTEGQVVGSAVVQLLQAKGIDVVDKTKFGTPDVVRKAYLQGDLDGAIDYTGSGANYVGPESDPVWSDPVKGYETIRDKDLAQNKIEWLTPAPANNTESIAVKKDFAEANHLKTLDDFAAYVNKGGTVKLIGDQSWVDDAYGIKGYQDAYGFTLKKDQIIGLSNGDTSQFIKALAIGTNGVNVAEVYATDGGLADLGLVVLGDPKSIPPVYNPTPVFRQQTIEAHPRIPGILAPLFKTLTIENLQKLNKAVAIDGQDPKTVAKAYLTENGLLK